ncbi:CSL zinc finger [Trypanosoma vivax]|uniref:DPH-type MB domain-containing protein n=1 Tax=Trypanosoma vivax (strain Y486) TaxID=1055687 RepID=G0U3U2_TRYVY|nr:hypothetical protein TRVL_05594 [Trypanosoma vivax]KAH8618716.1 CSL zinc finger [Trypanosoma vivax]CCC50182.1 conserved hypothetical protein [Trypanosoma vivax Y486]
MGPFLSKQNENGSSDEMYSSHYEEVSLSEMTIDGDMLRYPCPCGDLFELSLEEFAAGANIAQCPTCSLTLRIICTDAERQALVHKCNAGINAECAAVLS